MVGMERMAPTIHLLPGMDGTGELFAPLLRELEPMFRCIVHRYNPMVAHDYEELFGQLRTDIAGSGPHILVAESFSGPLAIRLAADLGVDTVGVVLCASFAKSPHPVALALARPLLRTTFIERAPQWPVVQALLSGRRHKVVEPLLRRALGGVTAEVLAQRSRAIAAVDVTADLRRISVPFLYLRATNDWVVPARCAELVRRHLPGVVIEEVKGPHLVLQVEPVLAAGVIRNFVESIGFR
jgi:pimeloyl-[acyl-carrier protein] methyl ester esterase